MKRVNLHSMLSPLEQALTMKRANLHSLLSPLGQALPMKRVNLHSLLSPLGQALPMKRERWQTKSDGEGASAAEARWQIERFSAII